MYRILAAAITSGLPFAIIWTYIGTKTNDLLLILDGNLPSIKNEIGAGLGLTKFSKIIEPLLIVGLFIGLIFFLKYVKSEWKNAKAQLEEEEERNVQSVKSKTS